MRVLILTHPRSGGMSLLQFITLTLNSQKELNYQMYHEPFGNNIARLSNKDINKKLLVEDNIVVKDFPFHIISRDYNLNDVISKFDKVIIHERDNHKDVAISLKYIEEKGSDRIHKTYQVTDEWVKDNEDNIHQMIKDTEQMYNDIQNISCDNCLRTSYDGLYNDKSDIPRLLSFLNIYSSLYLDVLDNRHRLQNEDVGMEDFKVKPKIKLI